MSFLFSFNTRIYPTVLLVLSSAFNGGIGNLQLRLYRLSAVHNYMFCKCLVVWHCDVVGPYIRLLTVIKTPGKVFVFQQVYRPGRVGWVTVVKSLKTRLHPCCFNQP